MCGGKPKDITATVTGDDQFDISDGGREHGHVCILSHCNDHFRVYPSDICH